MGDLLGDAFDLAEAHHGPLNLFFELSTTAFQGFSFTAEQAEHIDHLLAVVPQFDLRVFQEPAGSDFAKMARPPGAVVP